MTGTLRISTDAASGIEAVHLEHADTTYPQHTHTAHHALGIVTHGRIKITIDGTVRECTEGGYFSVPPDTRHAITPLSRQYSLLTLCVPKKSAPRKLDSIKTAILAHPDDDFSIARLSRAAAASPYHLIRKFTAENGLPPHRFIMQSRVRQAQRLLQSGMRVIDAAQATGFCDQSHLDRVFKRHVGMTPERYIATAILSNAHTRISGTIEASSKTARVTDMNNAVFEAFENGRYETAETTVCFADIPWTKHAVFEGVAMKHLITACKTGGAYSYHLVRIAPCSAIGSHIHDPQQETHEVIAGSGTGLHGGKTTTYEPGVITVMPAGERHEVHAGENGLFLFAKFMPALC